jgi:hypothetical protein
MKRYETGEKERETLSRQPYSVSSTDEPEPSGLGWNDSRVKVVEDVHGIGCNPRPLV